jgi:hypothetical protein
MDKTVAQNTTFVEVTCFDGSIGRDGKYARVKLPRPMTKDEARDFCRETDRCPPEAFHLAS